MKILYVTSDVLGDSGANAADIFPRLAVAHPDIEHVIVADFHKNKYHIEHRQAAEFLHLPKGRRVVFNAVRLARRAKRDDVDIIHIFYRQQNAVLAIFLRLALFFVWAQTKIIMDHRSVDLSKGWRGFRKKCINTMMQVFVHQLTGNPWAVETNHVFVFKPKHIIDLGYDKLPEGKPRQARDKKTKTNVWFIGTLKPRNRKSQFLIDVFERVAQKNTSGKNISIHVAGLANPDQKRALKEIDGVTYYGRVPRSELYQSLRRKPGIGLAFMNEEFHQHAPSLKFAEYAIMRFRIIASETLGLRTQATRMDIPNVIFVKEDVETWADAIIEQAQAYTGLEPLWADAARWSYEDIFARQIQPLYGQIKG